MKYDKLKKQVAGVVCSSIHQMRHDEANIAALLDCVAEKRKFYTSLNALEALVRERILAWDIRLVGKLRDLFPGAFPKTLRKGLLICDYSEQGDWCVTIQPKGNT